MDKSSKSDKVLLVVMLAVVVLAFSFVIYTRIAKGDNEFSVASYNFDTEAYNVDIINSATRDDFMAVKGIGESKASAIVDYREAIGGFKSIYQLKDLSAISDKLFDAILEYFYESDDTAAEPSVTTVTEDTSEMVTTTVAEITMGGASGGSTSAEATSELATSDIATTTTSEATTVTTTEATTEPTTTKATTAEVTTTKTTTTNATTTESTVTTEVTTGETRSATTTAEVTTTKATTTESTATQSTTNGTTTTEKATSEQTTTATLPSHTATTVTNQSVYFPSEPQMYSVDINTASASEIASALMIDSSLASEIVSLRDTIGYFSTTAELTMCASMTNEVLERISNYVIIS